MMLASMMDFCVNLFLLMTVCLLLSFAFCVILMRVALKDKPEVIDALGKQRGHSDNGRQRGHSGQRGQRGHSE